MPRSPRPTDLTINLKSASETAQTSSGPNTSPINVDLSSFGGDFTGTLTSLPPLPSSPPTSPRHQRDPSKNFLSNFKNRTVPEHEQQQSQIRQVKEDDEAYRPGSSSMSKIYHLRKNPGSTPELSLVGSAESVGKSGDADHSAVASSRPQPSPHHSEENIASKRKDKPFRNPLTRTKSTRRDSHSKSKPDFKPLLENPPKTAPFQPTDWPGSDMNLLRAKDKAKRGKSAERAAVSEGDDNVTELKPQHNKEKEKEKGGFMSGSKHVVSKATKGGGNLFTRLGKIGRSSSSNEKEVPDNEYVLKIINQPLVEQTRITRISKDLSSCRDKTEYWMPSLPWRCIDYLNLNCESEGLYRVPGSGPQVKRWQRRFDTELDVDLLDEQDLYDPNNIGSMLKSWLRDLPTEIMPATAQTSLGVELEKENPDYSKMGQPAPQKLRDALSELSPFNYYLLFAITCHLSLLLSHKEQNKMDLNNLSICIGPCLRLERWLFNYLVGDWRHCWQGCFTEKPYLESEKAHEQGAEYQPPTETDSHDGSVHNVPVVDERAVHSSSSGSGASKPGSHYEDARLTLQEEGEQRRQENAKPETYRPIGVRGFSNGSISTPMRSPVPDVKRPSTAEDKKSMEGGSSSTTPKKVSHGRSKSDVPTTPVKVSSGADHSFPMPGRP
ncbi:hypothetical protein LTR36_002167 [Oleoguttula mirabilis]|uniref:Rho-GAP domain-containing protein n=1 Tax=Oleoguttula mirabilis TaxID=1507867 RepID=A0AAV9JLY2_9PEZI|nr:hypothetical protein LTR36_002167 [Oleoguttula mirabilis]